MFLVPILTFLLVTVGETSGKNIESITDFTSADLLAYISDSVESHIKSHNDTLATSPEKNFQNVVQRVMTKPVAKWLTFCDQLEKLTEQESTTDFKIRLILELRELLEHKYRGFYDIQFDLPPQETTADKAQERQFAQMYQYENFVNKLVEPVEKYLAKLGDLVDQAKTKDVIIDNVVTDDPRSALEIQDEKEMREFQDAIKKKIETEPLVYAEPSETEPDKAEPKEAVPDAADPNKADANDESIVEAVENFIAEKIEDLFEKVVEMFE